MYNNLYLKDTKPKEFHCSVLKNSRDQLQKYVIKNGFPLKKFKVTLYHLILP